MILAASAIADNQHKFVSMAESATVLKAYREPVLGHVVRREVVHQGSSRLLTKLRFLDSLGISLLSIFRIPLLLYRRFTVLELITILLSLMPRSSFICLIRFLWREKRIA